MAGIFRSFLSLELWRGAQPNALAAGRVDGDLGAWRGTVPNVLVSGRVDSQATVVIDKTGYQLVAGSYSPIKSVQQVSVTIGTTSGQQTAGITAVDLAKSVLIPMAFFYNQNVGGGDLSLGYWEFVNVSRIGVYNSNGGTGANPGTAKAMVVEFW